MDKIWYDFIERNTVCSRSLFYLYIWSKYAIKIRHTVGPGSVDPLYMFYYDTKSVKIFWTYSKEDARMHQASCIWEASML